MILILIRLMLILLQDGIHSPSAVGRKKTKICVLVRNFRCEVDAVTGIVSVPLGWP